MSVYDPRVCQLGEGPLWHPERQQLFWFDILGKRMLSVDDGRALTWQFEEHVSAAGWIDHDHLLIASETALFRFHLETRDREEICPLEADTPHTRSNDGRADPWGGFWIGTMGKAAERGAGAIYRYYKGKLTQLFDGISISNSICFSPDRRYAYFTDTLERVIQRQALDGDGWPQAAPEPFIRLDGEGLNPDGSVVDQDGCLWNAQWGASRVARYDPDGGFMDAVELPARQVSCPAFGGPELSTLFATSAATDLSAPREGDGQTFALRLGTRGQREHQVIL